MLYENFGRVVGNHWQTEIIGMWELWLKQISILLSEYPELYLSGYPTDGDIITCYKNWYISS